MTGPEMTTQAYPSRSPGMWSRRAALRSLGAVAGAGALAAAWPGSASAAAPAQSAPLQSGPTVSAADPDPTPLPLVLIPGTDKSSFNYSALTALGMAGYGVTEVGEMLTAVSAMNATAGAEPGYPEFTQAYADTFAAWGEKVADRSKAAARANHRESSADLALRASQYYAQALFYVLGTDAPGAEPNLFAATKANWQTFLAHTRVRVSPLRVPYGRTLLPAWIFTPDDSGHRRRPPSS